MSQLYPLLMSPIFDPRPWGTLDLASIYPNRKFSDKIGEAWLTVTTARSQTARSKNAHSPS